jgi:membrane-bound inhibitor of C-type lysozyme
MILLAACGPKADPNAVSTETGAPQSAPQGTAAAVYTCDDKSEIFALFANDSSGTSVVSLAIAEARVRLRQVPSASGAKYADSTATFWNKGDTVTFEWGGTTRVCTAMPTTEGGASTGSTAPSAVHGTTPQ